MFMFKTLQRLMHKRNQQRELEQIRYQSYRDACHQDEEWFHAMLDEAKENGRTEREIEIVLLMLKDARMSCKRIARLTKLTEEDINDIAVKHKDLLSNNSNW